MEEKQKTWFVCTPEYWTSPQIMHGDPDPGERGCDIVEVEAQTKRQAKVLAVRAFRKAGCKYLDDWGNPFTGVTAETFPDYPGEGTSPHNHEELLVMRGDRYLKYDCPRCDP